jgi:hypothetical protein
MLQKLEGDREDIKKKRNREDTWNGVRSLGQALANVFGYSIEQGRLSDQATRGGQNTNGTMVYGSAVPVVALGSYNEDINKDIDKERDAIADKADKAQEGIKRQWDGILKQWKDHRDKLAAGRAAAAAEEAKRQHELNKIAAKGDQDRLTQKEKPQKEKPQKEMSQEEKDFYAARTKYYNERYRGGPRGGSGTKESTIKVRMYDPDKRKLVEKDVTYAQAVEYFARKGGDTKKLLDQDGKPLPEHLARVIILHELDNMETAEHTYYRYGVGRGDQPVQSAKSNVWDILPRPTVTPLAPNAPQPAPQPAQAQAQPAPQPAPQPQDNKGKDNINVTPTTQAGSKPINVQVRQEVVNEYLAQRKDVKRFLQGDKNYEVIQNKNGSYTIRNSKGEYMRGVTMQGEDWKNIEKAQQPTNGNGNGNYDALAKLFQKNGQQQGK